MESEGTQDTASSSEQPEASSESHQYAEKDVSSDFTWRAVLLGCLCGVLVCIANIYFGLQTGYSSMMDSTSSVLGFSILRLWDQPRHRTSKATEIVLVQTVAAAAGCLPATAGLIGAIPALEYLLPADQSAALNITWARLTWWCSGLTLFGLIWAMTLRKYFVYQGRLPWPGSQATAILIKVLHGQSKIKDPVSHSNQINNSTGDDRDSETRSGYRTPSISKTIRPAWKQQARVLIWSATAACLWGLLMYFLPVLNRLPIFGVAASQTWLWNVSTSPGFFGTGVIVGPRISLYMLFGSLIGWGVLSPLAKYKGWAPGSVDDWEHGSRGWIVWVSLSALLAECCFKFILLMINIGRIFVQQGNRMFERTETEVQPTATVSDPSDFATHDYEPLLTSERGDLSPHPQPPSGRQQTGRSKYDTARKTVFSMSTVSKALDPRSPPLLLLVSIIICLIGTRFAFGGIVAPSTVLLAVLLSFPLSIIGIMSLGETDYNPMSGIGKISQFAFAAVVPPSNPQRLAINIVVGAIAEAGASQAGDISYDLKIGQLVGASPYTQLYGQIIGSFFGAFISAALYKLYTTTYEIPGKQFQVPVGHMWLLAAKLATGEGLPPHAAAFILSTFVIFFVFALVKSIFERSSWQIWIPGGIAFAIGIYNTPSFTITRAMGGIFQWYWIEKVRGNRDILMVWSSGLLVGESLASVLNLVLTTLKVPHAEWE